MLHTLHFSLQNAVYFIMLPFLVPVLFTFHIQCAKILNVKLRCQKVKVLNVMPFCTWMWSAICPKSLVLKGHLIFVHRNVQD
jgi:hypothetical protein